MRVLRLHLDGELGRVDLHPFVTVLHDLGAGREPFLAAIRAITQGRDAGVTGLVENQGLLIELAPGHAGPVGPVVNADVVVDVDSLPSPSERRRPAMLAQLDQLDRQASIDAALLEEARAALDPTAVAQLTRLQVRSDPTLDAGAPDLEMAAGVEIAAALAAWQDEPSTVVSAPAWVGELSERWEEHRRSSAACDARLATLSRRVDAASRRLATARAALNHAEVAAVPVLLSPEEENRLSELATRPIPRGRLRTPKGRPEDEQAEIEALLERVGQPTYSAYMMYRLAPTPAAEQMRAIDAAREAVQHAEIELVAATAARDEDPEVATHRERLEELRTVAAMHVGPVLPDDLGEVLSSHCEERPNPERAERRRHLVAVALGHGVDVAPTLDDESLAAHLTTWLAGTQPDAVLSAEAELDVAALERSAARHSRALQRLDDLEARASKSRRLLDAQRDELAELDRLPVTVADVLSAIAEEAERAWPGHERGPVPLVLTGSFPELSADQVGELLDRLEALVARCQILVVTDHPAAGQWAERAGLRRALRTGPAAIAG